MPLIELAIGPEWDKQTDWHQLCEQAVRAAISATPHAELLHKGFRIEVSMKLSDDREVRELNASYRAKDKPTNVLSFPLIHRDLLSSLANTDDGEILLGDLILAFGTCRTEAVEKAISLDDHVSHLTVHGTLHLLGYDHEEEADALVMEDLEIAALASLGIANPYSPPTTAQ